MLRTFQAPVQTWRVPAYYRLGFILVGAFLVTISIWPDPELQASSRVPDLLFGLAIPAAAWRPLLATDGRRLVVRGWFRQREESLQSLDSVSYTYSGLCLHFADGSSFSPPLLGEKSNLYSWLGRRSSSEDIGDALMSYRAGRRP